LYYQEAPDILSLYMANPERSWETLGDLAQLSATRQQKGQGSLVERLLFTGRFFLIPGAEYLSRDVIAKHLSLPSEELEKPENATRLSYFVLRNCSPELTGFGRFIMTVGASRATRRVIELTAKKSGREAMRNMRDFNRDARRQVRPINIFDANGRVS